MVCKTFCGFSHFIWLLTMSALPISGVSSIYMAWSSQSPLFECNIIAEIEKDLRDEDTSAK